MAQALHLCEVPDYCGRDDLSDDYRTVLAGEAFDALERHLAEGDDWALRLPDALSDATEGLVALRRRWEGEEDAPDPRRSLAKLLGALGRLSAIAESLAVVVEMLDQDAVELPVGLAVVGRKSG